MDGCSATFCVHHCSLVAGHCCHHLCECGTTWPTDRAAGSSF